MEAGASRAAMDAERAYFLVHARFSRVLAHLVAPRIRTCLEYICLINAVVLLVMLLSMHIQFVGQPACSQEFSSSEIREAQLIHIQVTGVDLSDDVYSEIRKQLSSLRNAEIKLKAALEKLQHFLVGNNLDPPEWTTKSFEAVEELRSQSNVVSRFGKLVGLLSGTSKISASQRSKTASKKNQKPFFQRVTNLKGSVELGGEPHPSLNLQDSNRIDEQVVVTSVTGLGRGPLTTTNLKWCLKWWLKNFTLKVDTFLSVLWAISQELVVDDTTMVSDKQFVEHGESSNTGHQWKGPPTDPSYIYSQEKGYLMLSEPAKLKHFLTTANVTLSANNACFGGRLQRLLIDNFVGYDTILMNSLLSAQGKGYLYNLQTKDSYNLNHGLKRKVLDNHIEEHIIFKFGVLVTSIFVYFTTTMSVSFTLRETQARMLRFTVQLQRHARQRLPTFRLIFVHVVESLVFVPIMIGILFFLFEFFNDQLLAFMVLTLVWLCELFTMVSVRTRISMIYFPRFFFLYFMGFHIYFFSFTYGFSYLAFFTMTAFMQHAVLFFWNRLEVPALQALFQRRVQQQQQQRNFQSFSTLGLLSALSQAMAGRELQRGGEQMPLGPIQGTSLVLERSENNFIVSRPTGNFDMVGDIHSQDGRQNFNDNEQQSRRLAGGERREVGAGEGGRRRYGASGQVRDETVGEGVHEREGRLRTEGDGVTEREEILDLGNSISETHSGLVSQQERESERGVETRTRGHIQSVSRFRSLSNRFSPQNRLLAVARELGGFLFSRRGEERRIEVETSVELTAGEAGGERERENAREEATESYFQARRFEAQEEILENNRQTGN